MNWKHTSWALALFLLVSTIHGQSPFMEHISNEDGLPGTRIFSTFQDRAGFIWLGTDIGLVRYDGYDFKSYDNQELNGSSLTRIRQDKSGKLWMHTYYGKIFFLQDDSLHFFTPWQEYSGGIEFERMFLDTKDRLWILGKKVHVPKRYDLNTKTWTVLEMPEEGIKFGWIIQHSEDRYLLTSNALNSDDLNTKGKQVWTIVDDGKIVPLEHPFEGSENNLIISQTNYGETFFLDKKQSLPGLYRFNGPDDFEHIVPDNFHQLFPTLKMTIRGSANKEYFISNDHGLFIYDSTFSPLFDGEPMLVDQKTSGIVHDFEGNYWLSTKAGNGIFLMPGLDNFTYSHLNSSLLKYKVSVLESTGDGRLLLGFKDGTGAIYDPNSDEIVTFRVDPKGKREVKALFYDQEQQLIWATGALRLRAFDTKGNLVTEGRYAGGGDDIVSYKGHLLRASRYVADVHALSPSYGSVSPLTEAIRKARIYTQPDTNSPFHSLTLREHRAFSVQGDEKREKIWVGFEDGLRYYDKDGAEHLLRLADSTEIIAFSMSQTDDGTIWIGTPSQGVIGIREEQVVYHFHHKNILPTNECRRLRTDGNDVWVGSHAGVLMIEPEKEEVWIYGKQDALPSNEILGIAVIDDWVFANTVRGISRFSKKSIQRTNHPHPTYITNFALFEKDTLLPDGVTLPYDQNNLRFGFLGLAYRARGNFSYKYRMLGLDSSWVEIPSSQRFARFSSLPAGTYTFEVKTEVPGDLIQSPTAHFSFSVAPPYWERWWFWVLVSIGLIGITSVGFLYRIRSLKEKNRVDQELRIAQLAAIKSQMNPHFIFNALNSIQDFILLNEKRQANMYLGKFADLMRLYLDMSNQTSVKLSDVIQALELYLQLEGIRFDDSFNYIMDVHESVDPEIIEIPAMVIQPYVENAIKHGLLHKKGERLLLIRFEMADEAEEVLACEIRDNGVGRKRAGDIKARNPIKRTSFATLATEKRLNLLNYGHQDVIGVEITDLYDPQGNPEGTQVNIHIPLAHHSSYSTG